MYKDLSLSHSPAKEATEGIERKSGIVGHREGETEQKGGEREKEMREGRRKKEQGKIKNEMMGPKEKLKSESSG